MINFYPECPNCGPTYYEVELQPHDIQKGIIVAICRCHTLDCNYEVKHIFNIDATKTTIKGIKKIAKNKNN